MNKTLKLLVGKMKEGLEKQKVYKQRTGCDFYTPKPGKPTGLSFWQLVGRGVPLLEIA